MTKEVNAGPVPVRNGLTAEKLLAFQAGKRNLIKAFVWDKSAQGHDYWSKLYHRNGGHPTMYTDLPDEAKAIIDAWCEELEGDSND